MLEYFLKSSETINKINSSIQLISKIMNEFISLNASLVKELESQRIAINNLIVILEFIIKNDPKYSEFFQEENNKKNNIN